MASFTPEKITGVDTNEQLECAMQKEGWNELQDLSIRNIDLTTLTVPFVIPPNVAHLKIQNSNLSTQGQLVFPASTRFAELKHCTLTVCPVFNDGLEEVRVDRNDGITELSPLPNSLRKLFCRNTGLIRLPKLPEGLLSLGVSYCQLQNAPGQPAIPNLPESLIYIDVQHNQIRLLPKLPGNLRTGVFSHNQLETIGDLPQSLLRVFLDNNQLRVLPTAFPTHNDEDVIRPWVFTNNPLQAPFNALLQTFSDDLAAVEQQLTWNERILWEDIKRLEEGAKDKFIRDVIAAHTRLRARNLAAAKTLVQPREAATGANWYYGTQTNPGVPATGAMNIIASFLTGKPGSAKQQKNALRLAHPNAVPGNVGAEMPLGAVGNVFEAQGGRRNTRRKGRKGKRSSTR